MFTGVFEVAPEVGLAPIRCDFLLQFCLFSAQNKLNQPPLINTLPLLFPDTFPDTSALLGVRPST